MQTQTKGELLTSYWKRIQYIMRDHCPPSPSLDVLLCKSTEEVARFMVALQTGDAEADAERATQYLSIAYALPPTVAEQLQVLFVRSLLLCGCSSQIE